MSIVIVRNEKGYTAMMSFPNERENQSVAARSWKGIHRAIDRVMEYQNGK